MIEGAIIRFEQFVSPLKGNQNVCSVRVIKVLFHRFMMYDVIWCVPGIPL